MDDDQQGEYNDPADLEQLLQQLAQGMELDLRPDDEQDYESTEEVGLPRRLQAGASPSS